MKPVYSIDGLTIQCLDDFYRRIGEAINGSGGYFGQNLDAFDDCLHGGYGTPVGGFVIEWRGSGASREALGYPATVEHLKAAVESCHPANRESLAANIKRAERGEGPTLIEIVGSHEPRGVELRLL